MKIENVCISGINALVIGEERENAYLFVHGKMGSKDEALDFAKTACPLGFQVIGIDLPEHGERKGSEEKLLPWVAVPEIENTYLYMKQRWKSIGVRANSIGAWLSMLALQGKEIDKALFVSPIADMENLIENMMSWANVTEEEMKEKGEISADFGETLSWEYLSWVRKHRVYWDIPTEILYGERDNLTPITVMNAFAAKNSCAVTVMKNGEHWFHTDEQLKFLHSWEERHIKN